VQLWNLLVSLFTWNACTLTLDVILLAFAWFDHNYYRNDACSVWPILGHQTSLHNACRLITGLQKPNKNPLYKKQLISLAIMPWHFCATGS